MGFVVDDADTYYYHRITIDIVYDVRGANDLTFATTSGCSFGFVNRRNNL